MHFKFDRFETEPDFDYLLIENQYGSRLRLDGNQETNIWVDADFLSSNFELHFFRKVYEHNEV